MLHSLKRCLFLSSSIQDTTSTQLVLPFPYVDLILSPQEENHPTLSHQEENQLHYPTNSPFVSEESLDMSFTFKQSYYLS